MIINIIMIITTLIKSLFLPTRRFVSNANTRSAPGSWQENQRAMPASSQGDHDGDADDGGDGGGGGGGDGECGDISNNALKDTQQ